MNLNPGIRCTLARPVTLKLGKTSVRYMKGSLFGTIIRIHEGDVLVAWECSDGITRGSIQVLEDLMRAEDYETLLTVQSLGRKVASMVKRREASARRTTATRNAFQTRNASNPMPSDVEAIRARLAGMFA